MSFFINNNEEVCVLVRLFWYHLHKKTAHGQPSIGVYVLAALFKDTRHYGQMAWGMRLARTLPMLLWAGEIHFGVKKLERINMYNWRIKSSGGGCYKRSAATRNVKTLYFGVLGQ